MEDLNLWNERDLARREAMVLRSRDWRNGAVVYQVMVDRFAPSLRLDEKAHLYRSPRRLRRWDELPVQGTWDDQAQVWTHEVDFWGGDLHSLSQRLDYLQDLGIDVVYLNPIFSSLTNHKYDTWDYHQVDPTLGSRAEVADLAAELHRRGMRLMLDGVFNHMGRRSPMFTSAQAGPESPWRDFFRFRPEAPQQAIGWLDVENLPELNLEHPLVQDFVFRRVDSVVQSYLREEQIDGWRLDVAFDLGFRILHELTRCAHEARPGSAVIGEIWNYPEEWHPAVDGVMNMHGRAILLRLLREQLSPRVAADMWETMVEDAGLDHLLKAWLVLDNHDTARLPHELPDPRQQRMARILQFTLPGSVCLYYGGELGMEGGPEPASRAPMRWDLVGDENPTLQLHRRLLGLRRKCPALRWGDFRRLHADDLFAFLRRTGSAHESVVVVANPGEFEKTRFVQLRDSKIQDVTVLRDALTGREWTAYAGGVEVSVPAREVLILQPDCSPTPGGYHRYRRLQ